MDRDGNPNKRRNSQEKRARIGERIKLAAAQAGLTLKELAESAGISPPPLIYQYKRGVIAVPEETLERIATATNVPVDFFDPDTDARTVMSRQANAPTTESESATAGNPDAGMRSRIESDLRHKHELAEAQNHLKPDRTAYMSTLDQMLALARTLENRGREAYILWRLGVARTDSGDLEEAKRNLLAARELFAAEGLEEYRFHATLDLAYALGEQGAFAAAESYLQEIVTDTGRDVRWRALISLGSLRYRQHDFEGALRYFLQATEHLDQMDADYREREAMPDLLNLLADVVRATGHYEEAMMLWSRCLQRAFVDQKADAWLESLMEVAQCCQAMGRIGEAKEHLDMAVALAGFLFEDEARLSIAQALLADVLLAMGSLEEARDRAHLSVKIANRVRAARPTILSALALAETNLAAGHAGEALTYAQEALAEASRTGRTREVAQAHELSARAYLRLYEAYRATGEAVRMLQAMAQARVEVDQALDIATRNESVRERVAAHLTRARCFVLQGDDAAAEQEARAALELTETGAVGLTRLLGGDSRNLPALLRSTEIDLPSLFAGHKVDLPALEWQAHYLEGTLLAKRLGPEEAFAAMRDAAKAVSRMLADLTQAEAAAFQRRHPDVTLLFSNLQRFALTEAARQETAALLESMRLVQPPPGGPALPPAR